MKGIPDVIRYRSRHDIHRSRVPPPKRLRTYKRFKLSQRILIEEAMGKSRLGKIVGVCQNISYTGMSFTTCFALKKGVEIRVLIKLGGIQRLRGQVIWVRQSKTRGYIGGFIVGMKFSEPLSDTLQRYLLSQHS